jgi:teichuronic acid biosynthesis protein TuaE
MIPLSILGSSIMMPEIGPIHLLPHWLFIIISSPVFILAMMKDNFSFRFGLNVKKDLHINHYIWFLIYWLFYSIISILWVQDQLSGLREAILFLIQISLIILIMLNIASLKDLKIVLWLFAAILIINYLVAYFEIFYNYHLPSSNIVAIYDISTLDRLGIQKAIDINADLLGIYKDIVTGTFYNTNALGTFLGLTFPLIFSTFFRGNKNKLIKILAIIFCILNGILAIYVASRILYISIILIALIYIIFYGRFYHKVFWCFIGVAFVWVILNRILPHFDLFDQSLITRQELFSTGKEIFLSGFYPFLGTGIGSLPFSLHNLYAEILFKFGPLVFIGYILFYFFILKNLYIVSKKTHNRELRYIGEGLFISLCGYTIGCLSDSSRFLSFDSWILIGLSLVVINMYRIMIKSVSYHNSMVSSK